MLDEAEDLKRLGLAQRAFVQHNLGWTQEQIDAIEAAGKANADEDVLA
jgi:hypothetical protein